MLCETLHSGQISDKNMRNMLKTTVSWDVTPEYSVASGLANCIPHGAALVYAYIEKTGGGG